MLKHDDRNERRQRRHLRVRRHLTGTSARPRISVYRSLKHIYAQIVDDTNGTTVVSATSLDPSLKEAAGSNVEAARAVGRLLAERAIRKGIKEVVFDRGGYLYHGRVEALADAAREGGLQF